jgi:hypothetical protein
VRTVPLASACGPGRAERGFPSHPARANCIRYGVVLGLTLDPRNQGRRQQKAALPFEGTIGRCNVMADPTRMMMLRALWRPQRNPCIG